MAESTSSQVIVLLGATSFVGRHLAKRLKDENALVVAVNRSPSEGDFGWDQLQELPNRLGVHPSNLTFVHLAADIGVSKAIEGASGIIQNNTELILRMTRFLESTSCASWA